MPYENPCNRRVNVLAAYGPDGPQPALTWATERGSWVAGHFVDFVPTIPHPPGQPLVVVLDNGSLHVNGVVKAARATLRQERISRYFLPPYSPKLNDIERIFGGIKAHDLPERAYGSYEALEEAIDLGFTHAEQRLLAKHTSQPGLPA